MKTGCLPDNEREAFKTKESDWLFTVFGKGRAAHLAQRVVPFAEALSSEMADHEAPAHHLEHGTLGFAQKPRAAVGMDSLVGLVVFLSGWGLKKFLDEVYELKLRKHVRKLLGENVAPLAKPAIFLLAIWSERLQKGAVVALSGDSLDGRTASEAKVTSIHLEAERLLELEQSGKPLVLLGIHNGLLVQGPLFFESLQQASDAVDVESRILDDSKKSTTSYTTRR